MPPNTSIGRLLVHLGIDRREFDREIRNVQGSVRGLGRTFAGALGAIGVPLGVAALARGIIRETTEAEKSQRLLEQAIISTGRAGRISAGEVSALADSLRKTSTFDDEPIQDVVTSLLRFRQIGERDLPAATQAVLDLAAATGGDLQSAARQVGIALNAPLRGLAQLKRAGADASPAFEQTIKSLVEVGRNAEAGRLVFEKLVSSVDGTAAAVRNTLGGALTALGHSFSELLEQDSLPGVREEVEKLIKAIESPEARTAADAIGRGLSEGLTGAAQAMPAVVGGFKFIIDNAGTLIRVSAALKGALIGARLGGAPGAAVGLGVGALLGDVAADALRSEREKIEREIGALQQALQHAPGGFTPRQQARLDELLHQLAELKRAEIAAAAAARDLETGAKPAAAALAGLGESAGASAADLAAAKKEADEFAALLKRMEGEFEHALGPGAFETPELDRVVGEIRRAEEDAVNEAKRQQQELQAAIEQPFLNAAENIQREFANVFASIRSKGIDSFKDITDIGLDLFDRFVGELVSLAIFQPDAVFGGTGVLGRIFGGGATPAAGAATSDVQGAIEATADATEQTAKNTTGLSAVLGKLAGLAAGAGGLAAGFGLAERLGLRTGAGSLVGGGAGALLGLIGGPAAGAAGGALGALIGGEISGAFGDVFGGRNPFANRSTASGAARGAALGTVAFPGLGTIIGAIIGAALSDTDKVRAAIRTSATPTGFRESGSILGPFGFVGFDAGRTEGLGEKAGRQLTEFVAAFDAQIAATLDPAQLEGVAQLLQTREALRESAKSFDREFSSLLVDRAAAVAREVLEQGGASAAAIDQLIASALPKKGSAGRGTDEIIESFRQITGLATAFADGVRALRGETISEGAQSIRDLNAAAGELIPVALALGKSFEEVEAARQAGLAKLGADFLRDTEEAILGLTDPLAAQLAEFARIAEERLRNARDLGLETVLIERRNLLERERLQEEFWERTNGSIRSLLQQITGSTSSPLAFSEVLGHAEDAFSAAVSARLGGDITADVAGAASAFLDVAREGLGSGPQFFAIFNEVRDVLASLAGSTTSSTAQQQTLSKILEKLNDLVVEIRRVTTIRPAA